MTSLLLESALRSLALGILVWLGGKLLRIQNPRVELATWTFVLGAAMSMPALTSWIEISLFGGETASAIANSMPPLLARAVEVDTGSSQGILSDPEAMRFGWSTLILALYVLGAATLLLRIVVGIGMARRRLRDAQPVDVAGADGTDVRVSRDIGAPITVGRTVFLPAEYHRWSESQLRAVLAHEISHAKHNHYLLLLVSRLYRAAFWFSPFSWWLHTRLRHLVEIASDDMALDNLGDRASYAEALVSIAQLPTANGLAMASWSNVSHRVDRVLACTSTSLPMNRTRWLLMAVCLGPFVLLCCGASWQASARESQIVQASRSVWNGNAPWIFASYRSVLAALDDAEGHQEAFLMRNGDRRDYVTFGNDHVVYQIEDAEVAERMFNLLRRNSMDQNRLSLSVRRARLKEQWAQLDAQRAGIEVALAELQAQFEDQQMRGALRLWETRQGALIVQRHNLKLEQNEVETAVREVDQRLASASGATWLEARKILDGAVRSGLVRADENAFLTNGEGRQ